MLFVMMKGRTTMKIIPIELKRKGSVTTNSLLPFMASDQKKCSYTAKEMMRVTLSSSHRNEAKVRCN